MNWRCVLQRNDGSERKYKGNVKGPLGLISRMATIRRQPSFRRVTANTLTVNIHFQLLIQAVKNIPQW